MNHCLRAFIIFLIQSHSATSRHTADQSSTCDHVHRVEETRYVRPFTFCQANHVMSHSAQTYYVELSPNNWHKGNDTRYTINCFRFLLMLFLHAMHACMHIWYKILCLRRLVCCDVSIFRTTLTYSISVWNEWMRWPRDVYIMKSWPLWQTENRAIAHYRFSHRTYIQVYN